MIAVGFIPIPENTDELFGRDRFKTQTRVEEDGGTRDACRCHRAKIRNILFRNF